MSGAQPGNSSDSPSDRQGDLEEGLGVDKGGWKVGGGSPLRSQVWVARERRELEVVPDFGLEQWADGTSWCINIQQLATDTVK